MEKYHDNFYEELNKFLASEPKPRFYCESCNAPIYDEDYCIILNDNIYCTNCAEHIKYKDIEYYQCED